MLRIHADRTQLAAGGRDLVFCTVTAEDTRGNPVDNARDCIQVSVTGPLKLVGQDSQQRRVVEFPGSEDWTAVTFPLEPVYGKQDVTFLSLPGCDFDFLEFRFL